ncbi:hypothetical protein OA57_11635, partial [Chelonobacter oris]
VVGALSAAAMANNGTDAYQGAATAKSAVENNFFDIVLNNPQSNWQAIAEGEKIKKAQDDAIRDYVKKENPIIYQTAEGAYYFISTTGKAIHVAREIIIDLAPMMIAPEMATGKKVYAAVSRIALSGGANIAAQKLSGQEFNWAEFGGAVASGYISPHLKTTKDAIRFNAGVGMAVGLANGGDGLEEATYSGVATYAGRKISNPLWSTIASEAIQKIPTINENISKKHE